MRDIGKGIMVAGIWVGVAITSFAIGSDVVAVAFFAAVATMYSVKNW